MNIRILLQSTTGNTRLVARYAARRLREAGHDCQIHTLRKDQEAPVLEGVDLLGVAFPVMYFRPAVAMEQLVDRLVAPRPGTPAFVLATAAGEPGAALHLMSERLAGKGFVPLDVHWVIAPSNYPLHLAPVEALEAVPLLGRVYSASGKATCAVGRRLGRRWRQWRPVTGTVFPEACVPVESDRDWLDRFLDGVLRRAEDLAAGRTPEPPDLPRHTHASLVWAGRAIPVEKPISYIALSSDGARCTRCNRCVETCPVGCITPDGGGVPSFGPGCTGCYACFNACEYGAISAVFTPHGAGRYAGPPHRMRELFRG